MKKRVFIAINLPTDIRETVRQLVQSEKETYPDHYADARMIPEQDWHITVLFLGDQSEESITTIEQTLNTIAQQTTAPHIAMRMLTTAPPGRPPRMIWVTTIAETNGVLGTIKDRYLHNLAQHGIRPQGEQFGNFTGHITLARLPEGRRIADHMITFAHPLTFSPKTIDLMESFEEHGKTTYAILKSIDFKPSV